MKQEHLDEGAAYPSLGPHYFAAREAADAVMAQFETEPLDPLLKKAADDFYSALHERVENFLISDVESNIQGTIWRQIDDSVKALLSGEKWALERYVLTDRYNTGETIRAAVAKHIPVELQNLRIADLEAENKRLREQLEYARR